MPLPVVPRRDAFTLHVEHRKDGAIFLVWKDGNVMLNQRETRGGGVASGFPGLAQIVTEEWQAYGGHRTRLGVALDQAVLHVEDTLTFDATVALLDAMFAPEREYRRRRAGFPSARFQRGVRRQLSCRSSRRLSREEVHAAHVEVAAHLELRRSCPRNTREVVEGLHVHESYLSGERRELALRSSAPAMQAAHAPAAAGSRA